MYELQQVLNGISTYIDNEILAKVNGWQKWVLGAGTGMALSNGVNLFNQLKSNPIVSALNVVDNENKINVDEMYKHLLKEAQKGPITFNVPTLGAMTLNSTDVDKLYNYIKG